MKKILLAASIALIATSCNSNDPTPDQEQTPISFSNSVVQTRAIMSDTMIKNSSVSLYGLTGEWSSIDVFENVELRADANGGLTYTDEKHYDVGKSYSFYAVYPQIGKEGVTVTVNEGKAPIINVDCANQADLLYASATGIDKTKNPVALTFAHKLSQIKINMTSEIAGVTATTATITAISKATMDLGTGVVAPEGNAAAFTIPNVASTELDGTNKQIGDTFMLPVQAIAKVEITLNDKATTIPVTGLELVEGKITTINIKVTGTDISFTQSVTKWENGGKDGSGSVDM